MRITKSAIHPAADKSRQDFHETPGLSSGVARALRAGNQQFLAQKRRDLSKHEYSHGLMPLEDIKPRAIRIRGLDVPHMHALADSIREVGLINALTVSLDDYIIAGHHRYYAIIHLRDIAPETFQSRFPDSLVPVRRRNLDYAASAQDLWDIEIAENTMRKDHRKKNYTPHEISEVVGYFSDKYSNAIGRPSLQNGVKEADRLYQKIQEYFGISESTARRIIRKHRQAKAQANNEIDRASVST